MTGLLSRASPALTLAWRSRILKCGPIALAGALRAKIHTGTMRAPLPDIDLADPQDRMELEYIRKVLTSQVYDVCIETPLQPATQLSKLLGCNVFLKREDLQPIFSFKLRGAYNKMSHLTVDEKRRGVVACSAGNHAQGVAMSAARLGIDAVIVMPVATPAIKVQGVRRHGGKVKVVLHGDSYDEAAAEAMRLVAEERRVLIHPYDDPYVIAGQGTIGLEVVKQLSPAQMPDAIFCCVGGGGLISGVALVVKQLYPEVKIIGVEASDAAGMTVSLKEKRRVKLDNVGLFADGAAVKFVGEETFRICQNFVDEMITVSTDDICAAIRDVFNDTRTIMEPAGALGVAGLTQYALTRGRPGANYVAITSGANMNFDRLRFVSERAVPDEALVTVKIPERPGSFLHLYQTVAPRTITEFSYRYNSESEAQVMMSFKTSGQEDLAVVMRELNAHGMQARDMTGNELAKLHARYLAGGRSSTVKDEVLYRFEFPEVPGALSRFLGKLQQRGRGGWNVSLWHYRNYGADIGHILVGLQVPPEQRAELERFLVDLGYNYVNETENPVYKEFLA